MQAPQPLQPVITVVPVVGATTRAGPLRFPRKTTLILGILQILLGVACICVNAAAIAKEAHIAAVSHGIWSGVLFIVTGGICIGASYMKNNCMVISTMVLSIISMAFAVGFVFSLAVVALNYDIHYQRHKCHFSFMQPDCYVVEGSATKEALDSLLLIFSLLEAFTALATTVFSMKAVCCNRNNSSSMQQVNPNVQGNQAVMYVANTQAGFQPYVQQGFQPVLQQPQHQPPYPVMMIDNNAQYYQAQGLPQSSAPPQVNAFQTGVSDQTKPVTPPPAYASTPPYDPRQ